MTRDELVKQLRKMFFTKNMSPDEDYEFKEMANFILANWKEFIPEGYKKYEGEIRIDGEYEYETTWIGDLCINSSETEGKHAILLIEDK